MASWCVSGPGIFLSDRKLFVKPGSNAGGHATASDPVVKQQKSSSSSSSRVSTPAVPVNRKELVLRETGIPVLSTVVAAVVKVVDNLATPGYCHVDPHNELHGSVVTWGDTLIKVGAGQTQHLSCNATVISCWSALSCLMIA